MKKSLTLADFPNGFYRLQVKDPQSKKYMFITLTTITKGRKVKVLVIDPQESKRFVGEEIWLSKKTKHKAFTHVFNDFDG
jgi:hypothetical protein